MMDDSCPGESVGWQTATTCSTRALLGAHVTWRDGDLTLKVSEAEHWADSLSTFSHQEQEPRVSPVICPEYAHGAPRRAAKARSL